jgi:hypothetical protein
MGFFTMLLIAGSKDDDDEDDERKCAFGEHKKYLSPPRRGDSFCPLAV